MLKNSSSKKKLVILSSFVAIIALVLVNVFFNEESSLSIIKPTLTLEPPAPIEVTNKDEFIVDVKLSRLPKDIYPAASISLGFDNNKLEFTGVKMGTMETYGDKILNGSDYTIPTWDCNVETSNKNGVVNAMYLDMTAGKFAYNEDGFEKDSKDIVLRLAFKLKDSAQSGENYYLDIKDAVFATVDGDKDKSSLSTLDKTLKINNCSIVVKK
jgi:hypothetical protein